MLDHAYLTILASAGCPSVKIGHHMPLQLATCRLYPCAHCIITGAAASAIAAILGTDISNDAGRDALLHDPARLQRRGFGSPHLYLCRVSLAVLHRGWPRYGVENWCLYCPEASETIEVGEY